VPLLRAAFAALLVSTLAPGLAAQVPARRDPLSRAFDLERRGATAAAADAYREALAARPGDLAALLGLERAMTTLGRPAEVLPALRAALAASPASGPTWGVAIRVHALLGEPDSARAALDHWAAIAPESEDPYRELGRVLAVRRDRAGARRILELGRERLGRPDALAAELAELWTAEGRYPEAAREWVLAMRTLEGYRHTAATALAPAPTSQRAGIVEVLGRGGDDAAATGASLAVRWGDPVGGFRVLERALPEAAPRAAILLREFIEQVTPAETPQAHHAHGLALEALAGRLGAAQAPALRGEAARAYAQAGRPEDARRMLDDLAADGSAPAALQADAAATLVTLLVEEGRMEEAEARLAESGAAMAPAGRAALTRVIALGWARRGDLDRADRLAAADSSVEGLALLGRLRLFRGDVAGARAALQAAGPFAGGREPAAERVAILALLAPVEADRVPGLGAALLAAERGDTTAAVDGLEDAARELGLDRGGAGLLVLAGRMEVARGRDADAERLLGLARTAKDSPAAPAALLELARLALARGRPAEAVPHLEALILEYPTSALVPQARRLLDEARGAVPRS
jgi:hypothetical protein